MNVNDNINMEYEARVLITPEQYLTIKNKYLSENRNFKEIVNENYYFDTPEQFLTNYNMVLRIRTINDEKTELTLKIQEEKGCLEINQSLTSELKDINFEKIEITNKEILNRLKEINIKPGDLKLITSLKTERIEIQFPDYLFVIDKNYYRGKVDYNLEVESVTKNDANRYLFEIISEFGIEYKKDCISKSKRAICNL